MRGTLRVVLFNWPKYALCALVVPTGLLVPLPGPWRFLLQGMVVAGLCWVIMGLLVTWIAYDVSPLYDWRWVLALLPAKPRRYAVVSTGLDEISGRLADLLPDAEATLLDLYGSTGRDGSIRRARRFVPPPDGTLRAVPADLLVPDATMDAIFVVFAAHELRDPGQRRALYGEIARTLRPGGRLVLVEHCRDAANIVAYGPGAWHFSPRSEWLRLARGAHLTMAGERLMTPLIHALACVR